MTDARLYFAILVPVLAIIVGMVVRVLQMRSIGRQCAHLELRFTRFEIRFIVRLLRLCSGRFYWVRTSPQDLPLVRRTGTDTESRHSPTHRTKMLSAFRNCFDNNSPPIRSALVPAFAIRSCVPHIGARQGIRARGRRNLGSGGPARVRFGAGGLGREPPR